MSCMELMHDFVKGCVYCISGKYTYLEDTGYFVCDARVKWKTKHYKLNTTGSHISLILIASLALIGGLY